jgi:hypothetical protein
MKSARQLILVVLSLILGSSLSWAEETKSFSVALPNGRLVAVHIPAPWEQTVVPQPDGRPSIVKILAPGGQVQLQLAFVTEKVGKLETQQDVDQLTNRGNQRYVIGSTEGRLNVRPLSSESGLAAYGIYTDAQVGDTPKANEFRTLHSGFIVVKNQPIAFTVLSNQLESAEQKAAFEIVAKGLTVD